MFSDQRSIASTLRRLGLVGGPALAASTWFLLPDTFIDLKGEIVPFTRAGHATAALAVWMAVWWMTEAIPVYATSLLPLAFLPAVGAASMKTAAAPYGHELIFLFMGGFILALAMQRWRLDKRIAFAVLGWVGTDPRRMVGGFMLVSAFLSMWVSNTATTIMMLPIALSVIDLVLKEKTGAGMTEKGALPEGEGRHFSLCLMLGIAYASSIGGVGTLIGTPPNLFLASYIKNQLGIEISFVRWMAIGLPLVAIYLPVAWFLLTRFLFPIRIGRIEGGEAVIRKSYARLGPVGRGEWSTLLVFSMTVAFWIFRPLLAKIGWGGTRPLAGLTDTGIVMIAAMALFLIPVGDGEGGRVMNWETAVRLPWGVLLLFGGGLSLSAAIEANGVGMWLGHAVSSFAGLPPLLLVILVTTLVIFLTELTSNTATAATFVPILAGLAPGLGLHPLFLIVPVTIAASCAFMLPVATPPNAIVFSSGYVSTRQMSRAGLWLNLIGVVLITALVYLIVIPLLGISPTPR